MPRVSTSILRSNLKQLDIVRLGANTNEYSPLVFCILSPSLCELGFVLEDDML